MAELFGEHSTIARVSLIRYQNLLSRSEDLKFGFIGTGAITEALITGMLNQQAFAGSVIVSERSKARSAKLAAEFSQVTTESSNQSIVDQADWVFLATLPKHAEQVLSELTFRNDQLLISMVAGRSVESLKNLAAPVTQVHRIIPMPPIELGVGPVVIHPSNSRIANLFNKFGTSVQLDEEKQFSALTAASSLMATFFELVASQARWIESQGVPKVEAASYSSSLLRALSEMTINVSAEELQQLPQECLTVGGLNEQVLNESMQEAWFQQLEARLDRIAARLEAAKTNAV